MNIYVLERKEKESQKGIIQYVHVRMHSSAHTYILGGGGNLKIEKEMMNVLNKLTCTPTNFFFLRSHLMSDLFCLCVSSSSNVRSIAASAVSLWKLLPTPALQEKFLLQNNTDTFGFLTNTQNKIRGFDDYLAI